MKTIKNSIARIAPHYTMKRQLDDYYDKFYNKQAARFKKLSANGNAVAKEIALWKEQVAERWDGIHVVSKIDEAANGSETGKKYKKQYVIDEQGLNDAVGLELVVLNDQTEDGRQIHSVYPFKVVGHEGNNFTFEVEIEPVNAGTFKTAVRMYPKSDKLPHRQDFCYVKWLD